MEEFSASFHSLAGATIGERRKSLFQLLIETQQKGNAAELDFSLLQPKTAFEEKSKVEILIYFRRIPELVDVLKSENPRLITMLMKVGPWFWEEAFRDVTGEQLVTQLFPYISFNAKVKTVNRLSSCLNDPQRADALFEVIRTKYGLYLASKLLSSCSLGLIMNCIETDRLKPAPQQLLIIVKKNPEVTERLLKALKANNIVIEKIYHNVFRYFAKYDFVLFEKLNVKFKSSVRFGWRATNRFIGANRQQVIASPNLYYKFLHNKQIPKSLGNDFQDCFFNLFPSDRDDFNQFHRELWSILEQSPKWKKNVELYLAGYQKAYGRPLWDEQSYASCQILKMVAPDVREKVSKPDYFTEEEWNCYMKTDKSIPYLKKKIALTSDIKTRADLMKLLVKTCAVNSDKRALLHVCKYTLTKHRNDSIAVRLAFLRTLQSKFQLQHLEEQHWTLILQMLEIFALNNESFYEAEEFKVGYIHYRFINGLSVEHEITEWLTSNSYRLNIMTENPKCEKRCLLMCGDIIPRVIASEQLGGMSVRFLNALLSWNKRHPDDEMSLFSFPAILAAFKRNLAKERYFEDINPYIEYFARSKGAIKEQRSLLKICLEHYSFVDEKVMRQFMKFEPSVISESIDLIVKRMLKLEKTSFFWMYCKNRLAPAVFQKILEDILRTHAKDADLEIAQNSVVALSYLLPATDFLAFIVPYYPANVQLEKDTEEGQRMYKLQRKICRCLRTVSPSSLALNSIMLFCKSNSLMSIQSSLYSTCTNLNEDRLVSFVETLANRPALIRKHALHLTLGLLNRQHKAGILNRITETEKKASVRSALFKAVFNFFCKNPDECSWELVKLNASSLDNKKTFDTLMQIDKVPPQFMVPYVVFVWEFLSNTEDETATSKKAAVLNSLTAEIVRVLPRDFCEALIKNHLFKYDDTAALHSAVQSFTCMSVIYCGSQIEQEERLKLVFEILKSYVRIKWCNPIVRAACHKCVSSFLHKYCAEFLADKCLDKSSLIKLVDLWNGFLKPHEAFADYLHLQFTTICCDKFSMVETAQKVEQLYHHVIDVYGPTIVNIFCDKLNDFYNYILKNSGDVDEKQYFFIENLVRPDSSPLSLILVILMLKDNSPQTVKSREKYDKIVETLSKSTDPGIILYFDRLIRH